MTLLEENANIPETSDERKSPRAILWGLPVFLFLVSTVYIGNSLDPFDTVRLFLLKSAVLGGFLVWLSEAYGKGRGEIGGTPLDLKIVLLVAWFGLTGVYALNKYLWADYWSIIICCAALFFLTTRYFRSKASVEFLLLVSLAPVFMVAPFGMLEMKGYSIFPWDYLLVNKFYSIFTVFGIRGGMPAEWAMGFNERVSSTFGNPVYLAGFVVLLIPVAWSLFLTTKGAFKKAYSLTALFLLVFLLIVTFTRSSWICCFLSMIALALMTRGGAVLRKAAIPGAVAVLIVLIAIGVIFSFHTPLNPYFTTTERFKSLLDNKDESMMQRKLIWKTTWEMIKARPVLGVGLGNYLTYHPFYQTKFLDGYWYKYVSFPDRAHNEILDYWVETGLVGLGFIFWLFAGIVATGRKALSIGGDEKLIAGGILAGLFGLLIYAQAQFPLHVLTIEVYLWVFIAVLASLAMDEKTEARSFRLPSKKGAQKHAVNLFFVIIFLTLSYYYFMPVMGNIAFSWGERTMFDNPSDQPIRLMLYGMKTNPGNPEMAVKFGMLSNLREAKLKSLEERDEMAMLSVGESEKSLMINPYESRLYMNIGTALMYAGHYNRSIDYLLKATEIDPINVYLFYNLGIAFYEVNRYNEAVKYFKKSLDTSSITNVHYVIGTRTNIGMAYLRQGLFSEARETFEIALQYETITPQLLNAYGKTQAALGRKSEAVSSYKRAVFLFPDSPESKGNLALEYMEMGNYEAAVIHLKDLLAGNNKSGYTHFLLGKAYYMMGDTKEAVNELKTSEKYLVDKEPAVSLLKSISGGEKTR